MASQTFVRTIPNISRSCLKRAFISQHTERYQSTVLLQLGESDINEKHGSVIQEGHLYEHLSFQELSRLEVPKPRQPKLNNESSANLLELRLQLLQKQLQCPEDVVLNMFKTVPRLCDLKLLDEVIRNIEIMLYLYKPSQIAWIMKRRAFCLTQVGNSSLQRLALNRNRSVGILEFLNTVDGLVKGDNSVTDAEFFSSLFGAESFQKQPLVLTSGISYSNIKEKFDYLLQEGVARSFLQDYSIILMYSMKRLDQEVQYIKREFGEIDPGLLRARMVGSSKSKGFRKSISAAAKLLDCQRSAFTSLQKTYLSSIFPTDVENSIKYLYSIGFSSQDIRTCVYIIGQAQDKIETARSEVLKMYSIGESSKETLINAIYYQIKKREGFGT